MVSIEGVDYSYSRPGGKYLASKGKKFAVRYLSDPGSSTATSANGFKGISQAEYNDLHAAGIAIPVVWEGGAGDMRKGKVQGIADAKAAQAGLKRIVGLGDNLPVYFACDFDATPGDQTAINAYLDGAAEVLGRERVGIYGGYYPVKRAKDAKKATWFWQTYAWSGGQILAGIHLYQYKNGQNLNGAVDLCRALQTEYGQHNVETEAEKAAAAAAAKAKADAAKAAADKAAAAQAAQSTAAKDAAIDAAAIKKPLTDQEFMLIKSPTSVNIYIFNPLTGTKRHITAHEWAVAQSFGMKFVVLSETTVNGIPNAA